MIGFFGTQLRKLRKKAKLTQASLAEKLEVNQSTVANWELGRSTPPLTVLERIATTLDTTVASLTDDSSVGAAELGLMQSTERPLDYFSAKLGSDDLVVVSVLDDAMAPAFHRGDHVGGHKVTGKEIERECKGKECIIKLRYGHALVRLLKDVESNGNDGECHLSFTTYNKELSYLKLDRMKLEDIEWCAPVSWIIRNSDR